ncbi:MAG: ABC transporter permease [Acidimicrobiia bacterium]|nr:ABC transporter permease [Acidimicrobiia bacterium]
MTALFAHRPWRVVERNAVVARRQWYVFLAGGVEPFLFLFSVGVGVGELVDAVTGPGGASISYREFVAPAMMATAAMNTVVFDLTIAFFVRFKYINTYDAMLVTPLTPRDLVRGELLFSLGRVALYATAFAATMAVMGLMASPWAVLAVPAALLVGFAFGGVGMAASTWMRSWLDFDYVFVVTVPLFLFSGTFFPLDEYPGGLQLLVQASPLYHGADLIRHLVLGGVGVAQLWSVLYLVAMGTAGLAVAQRRIHRFLQP